MKILLIVLATLLSACAGPMAVTYTAVTAGSLVSTGKTPTEHVASKLTGADCSIWDAVVDLAYICEYNRNPAVTYNRNPF